MQKGSSYALPGNKISGVDSTDGVNIEDTFIVEAYTPPDPSPYTPTQVLCSYFFHLQCYIFFLVRFTPTQLETCLLCRRESL